MGAIPRPGAPKVGGVGLRFSATRCGISGGVAERLLRRLTGDLDLDLEDDLVLDLDLALCLDGGEADLDLDLDRDLVLDRWVGGGGTCRSSFSASNRRLLGGVGERDLDLDLERDRDLERDLEAHRLLHRTTSRSRSLGFGR